MRVQKLSLPQQLEVAVGAGGAASGAHQGNGLPLLHPVPLLHQQGRAVGVIGDVAVAVVQFDQVTVGPLFSRPDYLAAGGGGDGTEADDPVEKLLKGGWQDD